MLDDVYFVGNSSSSWWLITGNHDNLDTGGSALVHRQVDLWSWWIVQGNNTDECQVVHWEAACNTGVVLSGLLGVEAPLFPGLGVEGITGFAVLTGI
jgi:hypothetical protein